MVGKLVGAPCTWIVLYLEHKENRNSGTRGLYGSPLNWPRLL